MRVMAAIHAFRIKDVNYKYLIVDHEDDIFVFINDKNIITLSLYTSINVYLIFQNNYSIIQNCGIIFIRHGSMFLGI